MSVNTNDPRTFYEILGLKQNATQDEIRAAYRDLAKKNHPDRWENARQAAEKAGNTMLLQMMEEKLREATEEFKLINDAYQILSDPDKRSEYDAKLRRHAQQQSKQPPSAGSGPSVAPPDIRISKTRLDFGQMTKGNQASDSFTVSNVGGQVADYEIGWQTAPDWAEAEAQQDPTTIFPIRVRITVDTNGASIGYHEANILIVANGAVYETVTVSVNVVQPAQKPTPTYTKAPPPPPPPAYAATKPTTTSSGSTGCGLLVILGGVLVVVVLLVVAFGGGGHSNPAPGPTTLSCPPSRLNIGQKAHPTERGGWYLYSAPGGDGSGTDHDLQSGGSMTIIGGPVIIGPATWWKVRIDASDFLGISPVGHIGWTVENAGFTFMDCRGTYSLDPGR